MDAHEKGRTTSHSRMLIVAPLARGQSVVQVATSLGLTPQTVRKWRDRHAAEGQAPRLPAGNHWHTAGRVPLHRCVGLDLGVRDHAYLPRIGDHHLPDMRRDHFQCPMSRMVSTLLTPESENPWAR